MITVELAQYVPRRGLKSVLNIRGTYYQGWFMYMRYTQGQNEEYLLSRSVYQTRYLLSGLVYVHEVYTGTE